MARSEERAMHPTIAEQLAAMHRRQLQEAAMMPYDTYRLYEIERPKTAAQTRLADERAGRLAAAAARTLRRLTRTAVRRPAADRGILHENDRLCDSDRATERIGV
jgi:hypothetical protein